MAKVALLVGVSEYEPGLNPLPGAVRDVEALQEVLLHPDIGGFLETDIIVLKNPERQDVEEAIERLFTHRQRDDLVLFYFSGHGIKDDLRQLYLATRKTRKNDKGELIRSTAVAASFIQQCMGVSRSKRQVVILDSCFSGAFAEGLFAKDDGTVNIREQLGGEGRAVLTSSTSTQYSFADKEQDLSIYTRFLIEGIKSGEADRDQDEFISIDELHEYVSQKVREYQPQMNPEIYAVREGFKIRLAKVAPGDPSQRYRQEVLRFINRGEISFVGRRTLDVLKTRLGLETTAAKAIEDEILEPYRQEFRGKLQEYEQLFTDLLQQDETITEATRNDLQKFQQMLGLRNEDTMPIEARVTARLKTYQQNLQTYEQAFADALQQEYPLRETARLRLRQTQQQLELTDAAIAPIEARITAKVEAYRQNLQQYEQIFATATRQEYPLSQAKRVELQRQQQLLGLTDVDVAVIEARIITEIEAYQQKLQQYEQAFRESIQFENPLSDATRQELRRFQRILELDDAETSKLEAVIIQSFSEAEERKQQERIRQQQAAEQQRQQEEAERLRQQQAEERKQQERIRQQQEAEKQRQQEEAERLRQQQAEKITRQKFLKWAGLGGAGLVTAVVGNKIFNGQSQTPQPTPTLEPTNQPTTISVAKPKYTAPTAGASKAFGLPLWTVEFETVTVDEKGQPIKKDSNRQAKFFKDDLGNGVILEMVSIPGGSFKMGSPSGEKDRQSSESRQHDVNVPAFFMGRFEVTQEQYQQVMGTNPSNFKGEKRPVQLVSWHDAVAFCKKLSQNTGRKYRLPSEAEWEYACRAGTTTPFYFGETITAELVNYNATSTYASAPQGKYRSETTPVGSFPPNAFGLYDMHGNVWEWCLDDWHGNYEGAPRDGTPWLVKNDNLYQRQGSAVLRGGSWYVSPGLCRSASRDDDTPRVYRDRNVGFRVVCAAGRILQ